MLDQLIFALLIGNILGVESFGQSIQLTGSRLTENSLNQSPLASSSEDLTQSSHELAQEDADVLEIVVEEPGGGRKIIPIPGETSSRKIPTQHSREPETANAKATGCSICLEDFPSGDGAHEKIIPSKKLHCGHCFHDECIKQWLKREATCPLCRMSVPHGTGGILVTNPSTSNSQAVATVRNTDRCAQLTINILGLSFCMMIVLGVLADLIVAMTHKN